MTEHLWGLEGAEHLHFDVGDLYETDIEPHHDHHDDRPIPIEEWSVHPVTHHLPTPDALLDWLDEWVAESGDVDEDGSEAFTAAVKVPAVLAAVESLYITIGANVSYRMADKLLATHEITWDDDGEPLLDGERLYRPTPGAAPTEPLRPGVRTLCLLEHKHTADCPPVPDTDLTGD